MSQTRCGLVALVGAPNVGKSSLLNLLVGEKVGIVSSKANTTRLPVRGVVVEGAAQVVLVDTPGLNESAKKFDRALVQQAMSALLDADVVMLVIDASRGFDARARDVMAQLAKEQMTAVLVLNKVDKVTPRSKLLALMTEANEKGIFKEVFAVDALHGKGVRDVVTQVARLLPEGPWLFPAEMVTDMPLATRLAEITREKAMRFLQEELPYGVTVQTLGIEEMNDARQLVRQEIIVAATRHKGMVIGEKGSMLEKIGSAARQDMQELLGARVHLEITVVVDVRWQEKAEAGMSADDNR